MTTTDPGSNIPVPDPSLLTTMQLQRELELLRDLLDMRFEVIETRLAGMDQATNLLAERLVRNEADFQRRMTALREVLDNLIKAAELVSDQRFKGVEQRFVDLAERTEQAAQADQRSLNAALAAQKEAVSEQNSANTRAINLSNAGTAKEIDAIKALIAVGIKSVEDKIIALSSRLDRAEGQSTGERASRTEQRLNVNTILAAVTTIVGIVGLIVAAAVFKGG